MAERSSRVFDLDGAITARLDRESEPDAESHLQALAILIDADLTDGERGDAFATVMTMLLDALSEAERERFRQIADRDGEAAAMVYLSGRRWSTEPDRR